MTVYEKLPLEVGVSFTVIVRPGVTSVSVAMVCVPRFTTTCVSASSGAPPMSVSGSVQVIVAPSAPAAAAVTCTSVAAAGACTEANSRSCKSSMVRK